MVAAAIIGSAAVGAVASNAASDSASDASADATEAQGRIADGQTQLGRDQLAFNQRVYDDGRGMRDQASQTAIDVSKSQLVAQDQQTKIAADYDAYNKGTFRPLEQSIVSDAQGYDTAGRRADAVAGATSDVEQAYKASQDAMTRTMRRGNVSSGSGRSQALMQDMAIAKANSIAGATTGAVRNVETVGAARKADAANLGRGLPSSQAVAANSAITAGNSATSNAGAAVNAQMAGAPIVNAGFNGAVSANSSAGNLYGQAASSYNQTANASAGAIGAIGNAAGRYAGNGGFSGMAGTIGAKMDGSYNENYGNEGRNYTSDKNKKTGTGRKINTKMALKGIEKTPVKAGWKYDAEKGGAKHDGPMAQDVAKHMGKDVAPGGKKIDIASMNGRLMGAMQELAKRMTKLEARAA